MADALEEKGRDFTSPKFGKTKLEAVFGPEEIAFVAKNFPHSVDIQSILSLASGQSCLVETGASFLETKSLILKFISLPNSSIKNGYICLQCYDASNTSISCLCVLPKVEYLQGLWEFKEYSVRYFAPCKEQPHCKNSKCRPSRVPYLQLHSAGTRLQISKLSSSTNIKCCSKALSPNCTSLSFILKAVTPLISMKKKKDKSYSERRKRRRMVKKDGSELKHIFLIVEVIEPSTHTATGEKYIELKGKYAVAWYPFLHVDSVYEITNLSKAALCISGIKQDIFVPYACLKSKVDNGPLDRTSKKDINGVDLESSMRTLRIDTSIPDPCGNANQLTGYFKSRDQGSIFQSIRHLRTLINYYGVVTNRLYHDVYEIDGRHLLLLSFSGEVCTNGGVAFTPNTEIYMKNVHIVVKNKVPITVVFATCAVSQVQIRKFSSKTLQAPSGELQGHCLKNNRSRSHFVHFCRKYNFNIRELLWANRAWQILQHKFLLKESCMGIDIVSKLCNKVMKSLNVLPKLSHSSGKNAVINHNSYFVDDLMTLESTHLRATTSRNIYLEFLFHDECCNRNLDFIVHSGEANIENCNDVFFTPRSNVSFPEIIPIKELIESKSRNYCTLGCSPLTIATHSSKMFEKGAVVLLAYLDGCGQTGKLVLRDGTGALPVIIENKDSVDSDFWFKLLADTHVDGICDTRDRISNCFIGETKKILKLNSFWIIDEYYCSKEDILSIGSPGQHGHRRHVRVCKDDFDLAFSCSYNPIEVRSNITKSVGSKSSTEHNSQRCYSLCVCITNVSHVSLREYQRKSPYFGLKIHGYLVEPSVHNIVNHPILSHLEEKSNIVINAGYAFCRKLPVHNISKEPLRFFNKGFPSSIGLLSLVYPKHRIFRISFNNSEQISIEKNTINSRNKTYVLNLDFKSTIEPAMMSNLSQFQLQNPIPTSGTFRDTGILSVSQCLALGASTPNQNRSNVNVRGILYRKVIEDARSRSSKRYPKIPANLRNALGIGNHEKKLKITLQDEMTLDRIDFFFDCAYVVLPQGMHTGCVMCLEHLFLRVKRTNVYLAEQSFNIKKRTKSTKISIVQHTLHRKDCIEKTPSLFDFNSTTRMLHTRRGYISKLSKLNMFVMMKYHVFIRELIYVIVRQTKHCAHERKASFSWECSVLADDGTGEAKIFFDGDIVLELLNICKKTQSMVEDAAIRKNTCFEYSNAREITESMTNSQRLDVDAMHEKDFGSNSVASLSSAFRNLVRTSFTAREAAVFCKAKQLSTQSTTTVNIFVNDQQIESKRILRARLRCYYICCTSKRSICTSYKETVPYRLEAYNNIQNAF